MKLGFAPPALVLFDVWEDAENITNRTVKAPPKRDKTRHQAALAGRNWHYVAQERPLYQCDTMAQMTAVIAALVGKRLLYRDLIADNGLDSGARK